MDETNVTPLSYLVRDLRRTREGRRGAWEEPRLKGLLASTLFLLGVYSAFPRPRRHRSRLRSLCSYTRFYVSSTLIPFPPFFFSLSPCVRISFFPFFFFFSPLRPSSLLALVEFAPFVSRMHAYVYHVYKPNQTRSLSLRKGG